MKTCTKCGRKLPESEYSKEKTGKDGLRSQCSDCGKERSRKYYKNNRLRCIAATKRYQAIDSEEKRKKKNFLARVKNREYPQECRRINKKWRTEHREQHLARRRARHAADPEKRRRSDKRESIRKTKNAWIRRRRSEDRVFAAIYNMKTNICKAVRADGAIKHKSTLDLLGCNARELRCRLESLWRKGMTWSNYGMIKGVRCWHIDHIIPCDWFDMNKPEEQAICFHWSNLQPLWADENLEKKARFAGGHNVRIYPVDGIAPDVMSIARAYGVGMRKDGDE